MYSMNTYFFQPCYCYLRYLISSSRAYTYCRKNVNGRNPNNGIKTFMRGSSKAIFVVDCWYSQNYRFTALQNEEYCDKVRISFVFDIGSHMKP